MGKYKYDGCGSLVPIGQGTKAGAGLGVKAIARESAKRVAKEAVKDMAVDFTAETMTNWAREELDLGDFQTELLKTGLEFGLDKGLDKVGSKHVPFTDDMTFSEAKRYNQSMQNMESGKQ